MLSLQVRTVGQMDPEDNALMNVLRFYPTMPNDMRKLAEARELQRIDEPSKGGRAALSLEDNATLDAWIRLPKGTDKERAALAEKLLKWAKIEAGQNIPETAEEKAERLCPGNPGALKENNLAAVWRRTPNTEYNIPFSDKWRNEEWLANLPGWEDAKANAKFFDRIREAKLHKLEGNATDEDKQVLAAYDRPIRSPRHFDLYLRNLLSKTDPVKWEPLKVDKGKGIDEPKELEVWEKYGDPWPFSQSEARRLAMKAKLKPEEFKLLLLLQGKANSGKN
jgi:hypothetical protein